MLLFLLDLYKTLLVDHGGRRLLALLDHQMDKVELRWRDYYEFTSFIDRVPTGPSRPLQC